MMAPHKLSYVFLSVFVSLVVFKAAEGTCPVFKSCSPNSVIHSISVADNQCQGTSVILKKNADARLEVDFTSNVDSSTSTSVCHGIIGGLPVPFPLPSTKGCLEMTPTCPIKKGQSYKYVTKLSVKKEYPDLRLIVKWEEQGDNGDIFCVEIPSVIEG